MKPQIEHVAVLRAVEFAFLALFVLLLAAAPFAVAQSEEEFHQQLSLISGGSVVVENGRGDVSIEGWDKAEMQIDARKIFDGDGADRERWMRETKIRVEGDDHHRSVKVDYPYDLLHSWGGWNGRRAVNLTIHLPRQINADLKTDRGRVIVQSITGKLDIGSDRGDVDISRMEGELRVHADRGDLKVRDSTIRGIRVSLDRGSADIALQHLAGDSNLEVSRGDLSVTLPKNASFTLDAERTRRSNFRTDFGVLARGGFGGNSIRGDVNGGGPVLRLRGERGDVWLHTGSQGQ